MPVYIVFTEQYDWHGDCNEAHIEINWAGTSRVEAESQFNEAVSKRRKGDWVECWLYVGQEKEEIHFNWS